MAIREPVRVGQDDEDEPSAYLVADKVDLDKGEQNGNARIEYVGGSVGPEAPLQQFYKFGVWYPVTGER
jgi:hypothetical protein